MSSAVTCTPRVDAATVRRIVAAQRAARQLAQTYQAALRHVQALQRAHALSAALPLLPHTERASIVHLAWRKGT